LEVEKNDAKGATEDDTTMLFILEMNENERKEDARKLFRLELEENDDTKGDSEEAMDDANKLFRLEVEGNDTKG
jgi:hypothetical protein